MCLNFVYVILNSRGILLKSGLIFLQMKRIHDKIVEFEELDLLVEKERQQLDQLKNMLFIDQLMLSFYKNTVRKSGECVEENARSG